MSRLAGERCQYVEVTTSSSDRQEFSPGVVESWDHEIGWGVVRLPPPNSDRCWFHFSAIIGVDGYRFLAVGTLVVARYHQVTEDEAQFYYGCRYVADQVRAAAAGP